MGAMANCSPNWVRYPVPHEGENMGWKPLGGVLQLGTGSLPLLKHAKPKEILWKVEDTKGEVDSCARKSTLRIS